MYVRAENEQNTMYQTYQICSSFIFFTFSVIVMLSKKQPAFIYFNPFKPMEFPILINWIRSFPFKGLLCFIFYFYSNLNRTFSKQMVETLIRHHMLQRLVWVCIICLCATKRRPGLYRLCLFFCLSMVSLALPFFHPKEVKSYFLLLPNPLLYRLFLDHDIIFYF